MSTKLKFRIVFCSSEDKEFPVTQLLKHGPNSKGWQSARWQDFPQILILQFICPVRIRQLQFLSHQSKISSKIELYTYLPQNFNSIPPIEYFKWKRLGYLSLDSNQNSNYQARELKSVYIDAAGLFLKIVMNKCHVNGQNMFNQVGLVAINAIGQQLDNIKPPTKGIPSRLEYDIQFDSVTSQKIKQMTLAKQRAVQNQDFDQAKRLKDAIQRLKGVGYKLQQFEERKRAAINNQDYDLAKELKKEIDRIRNSAIQPMGEMVRPYSGAMNMSRPNSKPQPSQMPQYSQQPEFFQPPAEPVSVMKQRMFGNDQQVIPTHQQGKFPQQAEEFVQNENIPEPLGPQQQAWADPLIPLIGEDICRKIFSRTWQFRDQGLSSLQDHLSKGGGSQIFGRLPPDAIFTGCIGAIRYTVGDKVAQVSLQAMNLLSAIFSSLNPTRVMLRGDVTDYLHNTQIQLLDKIGDNNSRVRDSAESALLTLARSQIVGVSPVTQLVLKPSKQKATSQKHIVGKLNLLNALIKEYRIDNASIPLNPVTQFALQGFKHQNADVRNAAYYLLIGIYKCVGQKLSSFLGQLRPAQLQLLENGFADVDGGTYQQQPRQVSQHVSRRKPPSAPQIYQCQFCGKQDSLFANEDNLDIHYWKDCPMLTKCPNCHQIVEIIDLNDHMLNQCEVSEVMRQCPRCKEAVHMEDYEQHIEEQACLPARPLSQANRCPLCHQDTDPGPEGWKYHILTDGCPNNERSSF